jgi:magnesium transporter
MDTSDSKDRPSLLRGLGGNAFEPPGTLFRKKPRKSSRTHPPAPVRIMQYDKSGGREWQTTQYDDLAEQAAEDKVTWIHVSQTDHADLLESVGKQFGIHPLILEDIANLSQRPKIEEHESYLFMTLKRVVWNEDEGQLDVEQISLILTDHALLSFQNTGEDAFEPIRERIRNKRGQIRDMAADYLLYAILDLIVDGYFLGFEDMGEIIERIEEDMAREAGTEILREVHRLRAQAMLLRRAVWPLREVVGQLRRKDSTQIRQVTEVYLRDLYDHTLQVMESADTLRDILAGLLDLYLSSAGQRTNDIMKVLTIIATIFMPLSFIAGVYGMNFKYMPELDWTIGYPLVLGLMVCIAGGMLLFFRRRGWL